MKKLTRILTILISGLLLISSFASCNENKSGKSGDGLHGEPGEFIVPEGACEEKTFTAYLAYPSCKSSFVAEEETGDEMNDVVFRRNQKVEEYLGVDLEFGVTTGSTWGNDILASSNLIRVLIMGGDTTYDVFVHCQNSLQSQLMGDKLFVNWNELPYINVESPWWYSNVARDITFGDKIYGMTGDYNLTSFSTTACLIFNKTMCDELGLEYPYEMVYDGTWTHDKFIEYVQAATKDLNGDGRMTRDEDRYGYGCWAYEGIPGFFVSYGAEAIIKDDNNMPVLNIDNEHTYNVIDKMLEIFRQSGAFWERSEFGVDDNMFMEGRLLFNDSFIYHIPSTRKYEEFDVGFIPYPKYNESQSEYYSRTGGISELTVIPITNTDLEKTAAVLETMAYFSNQTVMPAYFDTLVMIKSTRDTESEDMIPIIRNSARFADAVINFDGYSIVTANSGNTLSSLIAQNRGAWEEKIQGLIDLYSPDKAPAEGEAAE